MRSCDTFAQIGRDNNHAIILYILTFINNNNNGNNNYSLIFPRWDVICVIFSVFLLTYTYQEGKSNYFKGSILIMSYCVLLAGFYFIPPFTEKSILIGFDPSAPQALSTAATTTALPPF